MNLGRRLRCGRAWVEWSVAGRGREGAEPMVVGVRMGGLIEWVSMENSSVSDVM